MWYNSTSNSLKYDAPLTAAWVTGNNLNTARRNVAGFGIQTAALAFGGTNPPGVLAATEEWSIPGTITKTLTT